MTRRRHDSRKLDSCRLCFKRMADLRLHKQRRAAERLLREELAEVFKRRS